MIDNIRLEWHWFSTESYILLWVIVALLGRYVYCLVNILIITLLSTARNVYILLIVVEQLGKSSTIAVQNLIRSSSCTSDDNEHDNAII